MKKVETKFGVLYIEEEHDEREKDRIKVYDSNERYFDYFSLEYLEEGKTVKAFVEEMAKWIAERESLEDLLGGLGVDYCMTSEDWTDLLDDLYDGSARFCDGKWIDTTDGSEITEQVVAENEWVNKVGNTYILICE